MNLFDILSAGKRDLNEENVSSMLAWLLDPGQSHGCGPLFLKLLLKMLDENKFQSLMSGLSNSVAYGKVNNCKVDVFVEQTVASAAGKMRAVDIVIKMSDTVTSQVVAIENKIRNGACDFTQLKEENEGMVIKALR